MHPLHLNFPAIVPKSNFDTQKPGPTMLSDPVAFLMRFANDAGIPIFLLHPQAALGGQGHPLQARFDIKTLCLRAHRLKAVRGFAAQHAAYFLTVVQFYIIFIRKSKIHSRPIYSANTFINSCSLSLILDENAS